MPTLGQPIGLLLALTYSTGGPPAPEPEPEPSGDEGLTGTAGSTVLVKRLPRRMGGSLSWEKFERIMAELEAKDAALAAKAVKVTNQKKREKIEQAAANATAVSLLATPAVNKELEALNRAVARAAEARRLDQTIARLAEIDLAAKRVEEAILDEEDVEMLLLKAWQDDVEWVRKRFLN